MLTVGTAVCIKLNNVLIKLKSEGIHLSINASACTDVPDLLSATQVQLLEDLQQTY